MNKLIRQVIVTLATWATLIGFALALRDTEKKISDFWKVGLVVSLLLAMFNVGSDIVEFRSQRKRKFKFRKDDRVRRYITKWLKSGGSTTILTRDMSWVDAAAEEILSQKASDGALSIVAEQQTPVLLRLAQCGAKVSYYGGKGFTPRSRFTVVNDTSASPSVLVGTPDGQAHTIERFESGGVAVALAMDLAELAKRCAQIASEAPSKPPAIRPSLSKNRRKRR